MKEFRDYFDKKAIFNKLAKLRISKSKFFKEQNWNNEITNLSYNKEPNEFLKELYLVTPPRKIWNKHRIKRQTVKEKKLSPRKVMEISIENAIREYYETSNADWKQRLDNLIEEMNSIIEQPNDCCFENPTTNKLVKKRKKGIPIKYRPITQYSLKESIIISQLNEYFTDLFDKKNANFDYISFAFRNIKKFNKGGYNDKICKRPNNSDAFYEIYKYVYKNKNNSIYVAECDLKKYFDTICHKLILKLFDKKVSKLKSENSNYDEKSRVLLKAYLNSFSFPHNALCNGNFEWIEYNNLKEVYPNYDSTIPRLGIPQGGALSGFLANLILDEADKEIGELMKKDKNLFYVRYCDDMVICHDNEKECRLAFEKYSKKLQALKLFPHNIDENFPSDYRTKKNQNKFWNCKSKVYRFDEIEHEGFPWLSFVGYQINKQAKVRIRPSSIKKQLDKMNFEYNNFRKLSSNNSQSNVLIKQESKKKLLKKFESKLIAMSVGKAPRSKNYELCWVKGFDLLLFLPENINDNPFLVNQLKKLDAQREFYIKRTKDLVNKIDLKFDKKKRKSSQRKNIQSSDLQKSYFWQFDRK